MMAVALSMGFSACGDDDDNAPSGGSVAEEHECVDLGLPSGTLWATMNVGAKSIDDCGDYFAWGETKGYKSGKKRFMWDTYKFCNIKEGTKEIDYEVEELVFSKYNESDKLTRLRGEDDAATANWGSEWAMPTYEQMKELLDNCTWTWVVKGDVDGVMAKSKINGNTIYFPAGSFLEDDVEGQYKEIIDLLGTHGQYWTRTLEEPTDWCPCTFTISEKKGAFIEDTTYPWAPSDYYADRCAGLSVRAVKK